jgi:uncharacterized membrane protein YfcA
MTLAVDGHAVWLPGLIALGVVVGYVAGMFGVGGGFLLTPLLTVVFRVPIEVAVGTGLCQMVGTSGGALLRHQRLAQGEIRFDLLIVAGSLLGVELGARALGALAAAPPMVVLGHELSAARLVVELLYIVLLLGAALMFGRDRSAAPDPFAPPPGPLARLRVPPLVDFPAVPLSAVSATVVAYVGLGLGVMSGLLGLGGGIALMPILVYGFGFPIRQAAGTGVAALFLTSATGTFVHALRGHVDLGVAMVLLVGATVSAQLGAEASHHLRTQTLRRLFAALILVTVLAVAWDLARQVS